MTLEEIIREAQALSPDERRRLREILDTKRGHVERGRPESANRIRGKYADVLPSSEEFAGLKAEEIARENHA